jgi:hypothetical protein
MELEAVSLKLYNLEHNKGKVLKISHFLLNPIRPSLKV